jgi:DNA-directed RNA polymerase specialized sigma24 family protein
MDIRKLARLLLPQLSPEHQAVVNKVVVNDFTHIEAAAALGIPEGTVKSRLLAAKRALHELAAPLVPASQRGLL